MKESVKFIEIFDRFNTDEKARAHLEEIRWERGIVCPHCECDDQTKFSTIRANPDSKVRAGLRYCSECRRQFTVTVGTIFEDSHIPLRKWVIAWYLLCASKKGISSLQIQRMLDLGSYRTALFMMHRIRHALRDSIFTHKLGGTVEVDEAYIGGKSKTEGRATGSPYDNKTPVMALVERDGNLRTVMLERVTGKDVMEAIHANIAPLSTVVTDKAPLFKPLKGKFFHHAVHHKGGEFARKVNDKFTAHSNTAESSFSLLKRGVIGTFHSVSKKHLPLYLAEFDHRWNHRHVTDAERTDAALRKAEGKRLTYKPKKERASEERK